jgi:hypothetical protein
MVMNYVQGALSLIKMVGQGVSAHQAKRAAEKNADVQRFLYEREARNIRRASQREAQRLKKVKEKVSGRQRAVAAASGLQFDGSAMDVFSQSIFEAEAAALEELFRGEEAAFGARTRAAFTRHAAKEHGRQAALKGIGVAMTSFSQAGDSYTKAQASKKGSGGGSGKGGSSKSGT